MSRTEFSRATRRAALARSGKLCEASGVRYGLAEGVRCNGPLWCGVEFDHDLPDVLEGGNGLDNCRAICIKCHRFKTKNDIRQCLSTQRPRKRCH